MVYAGHVAEQDQIQQRHDDSSQSECDIFEEMFLSDEVTSQSGQIHSMDVQMAVFHCADVFLKQLMVTKLSQCQYALPLLVPHPFIQQIEFPLWTFRQINKSWKMKNTNNETISQNASTLIETRKGKYKIGLKDRNQSDVSEELRRAINACVSESSSTFRLEDVSKYSDISVDVEDDDDCRRGKKTAKEISLLKKKLAETKESFLPHQGKLWHQWSQKNKELHRPQGDQLENEISRKQIYESCSSVKKNKKDLHLAAEMMISGFPLELMDGDAAHVPVIWISAVLDQLTQMLGDQRVFVLSGKSTMLNAMFGLQFARSFHAAELAGRSTRHHDNELATFVIGLGNLTLINIFGENPSEMQDILQIVVQAFMRMKKNVSDVTAGEKNMEGRRRLQETLDEMTKLAAKEEVPPMAPPNPNYCENIQDLKKTIMTHAETSHGIKLKHLKARIEDLWEALLNERFVFSFRNSLEISAYRKLETEYSNAMLETENKLRNKIENEAIHEVEESDLQCELKEMSKE
ncbi:hypothetical protein M9458_042955, partial [Cirrhinus mrigala]